MGYVGELERLAQLRDQGILRDEEFQAKKQQILGI
jgi:Short C-terminal domain